MQYKLYLPVITACLIFLFNTDSEAGWFLNRGKDTKYGVLIIKPNDYISVEDRIDIGNNLGAEYQRTSVRVPDFDSNKLEMLKQLRSAGFGVVLNVANRTRNDPPSPPTKDIEQYKRQLKNILQQFKPDLLVIENEELADNFYSGTMSQYLDQLNASIEVAKPFGVPVSDGGITTLRNLTYINYKKTGQDQKAQSYAARTGMTDSQINYYNDVAAGKESDTKIDESNRLINGLKNSDVDFVNFHWYQQDPDALEESVAYLKNATGKKVITTEIGQYAISTSWINGILNKSKDLDLPFLIWYSGDTDPAVALHNRDGTLRPTGICYRNFMKNIIFPKCDQ